MSAACFFSSHNNLGDFHFINEQTERHIVVNRDRKEFVSTLCLKSAPITLLLIMVVKGGGPILMFCSEESGDSSDCPQGWALGGEFPLSLDEAARCPHSPHRPGPSHQVTVLLQPVQTSVMCLGGQKIHNRVCFSNNPV